jgi:hypothetical protein
LEQNHVVSGEGDDLWSGIGLRLFVRYGLVRRSEAAEGWPVQSRHKPNNTRDMFEK